MGLDELKLFMRYQIDLRILFAQYQLQCYHETNVIYSRGERSNTDTSTDERHGLVVQEVLGRRTEGTVDHDTREDTVDGRVRSRTNNLASGLLLLTLALLVEVAADGLGELRRKVTNDTDVDGDVVLLGGATATSAGVPKEGNAISH